MKSIFCLLVILSFFVGIECSAQKRKRVKSVETEQYDVFRIPDSVDFEERVALLFNHYNSNTLTEKLYIHTDKESCLAGDTIWFKAYLTSALTNLPCDYSRFMYIDVVDRSDSIYYREMYSRPDTIYTFSGNIPLAEDLRQGEYFIRAYTYWQQNQDEAFIYKKRIRVINPFDHQIKSQIKLERSNSQGKRVISVSFLNHLNEKYTNVDFYYYVPTPNGDNTPILANTGYNGVSRITINDSLANKIYLKFSYASSWDFEGYEDIPIGKVDFDVQFFPEGGTLIANRLQRVAFKSVGRDGRAVPVSGTIFTDDKRVVSFSSNELGMGSFLIQTDSLKIYKAVVNHESGTRKEYNFPYSTKGVALQVMGSGNIATYTLVNSDEYNEILNDCYVVIHSRGLLLSVLPATKYSNISLNLFNAPAGILHFALYHKSGKILSDRLWYHHKARGGVIDLAVHDYTGSNVREMRPISLNYSNNHGESADLSVTVVNTGQGHIDTGLGGIEAYQLLTSDLMGYIETPGYYFSDKNENRISDLDALLLTQGWSKFNVESILNESFSIFNDYYMERGQYVSGRVKQLIGDKVVEGAKVILLSSNGITDSAVSDSLGQFVFNNLHFKENTSFVVQSLAEEKRLQLEINKPDYRDYRIEIPYAVFAPDKDFYTNFSKDYVYADNGERISTLGTVSVKNYTRKTVEMIMKDSLEKEARINFLKGYTDVVNYGGVPLMYTIDGSSMYSGSRIGLAANSAFVPGGNKMVGVNYISSERMSSLGPVGESRDKSYYPVKAEQAKQKVMVNSAENLKSGDYMHPVRMHNEDSFKILGTAVNLFSQSPEQNNRYFYAVWAGAVVDNSMYSSVEISWDKQIFVPYAPQEDVQFYVPTYTNLKEEQKPIIDEIITRYWNPDLNLSSGDSFSFKFPAVKEGENSRYLMVVEGLTESGEPIYEVKEIR